MSIIIIGIAFILGYLFIEKWYRKHWDHSLQVGVTFADKSVYEGERSKIQLNIVNDKFLPLPILEVFFRLKRGLTYANMDNSAVSDYLYRRDVFSMGMKKKVRRTFEIVCERRGYYTLEKLELLCYDLFLQQKHLSSTECLQEFYVYPKKVASHKIMLPYKKVMGDWLAKRDLYEDPFSFAGIRDYTNQDSMNSINWKATAKSQELVVNLYDSSTNPKMCVVLDTYENKSVVSEELNEESIAIVAALTEHLLRQGVEVSLIGNSCDLLTKECLHVEEIQGANGTLVKQRLARVKLGMERPIQEYVQEIPRDTYVLFVSKNLQLAEWIQDKWEDYLWILPYQYQKPQLEDMGNHCILWELELRNL
ncbi:MAG: DUF58 domain-containing protein [Eubacteriales bacterium]